MTKTPQEAARQARAPFRLANPIASAITLVYGFGNIAVGIGLITYQAQLLHLLTVNKLTTYPVWGVVFTLVGIAMLVSHHRNEWYWMKNIHLVGIIIKSFWMVGLIARYFSGDTQNTIVPTIWAILLAIQVVIYTYFVPPPVKVVDDDE